MLRRVFESLDLWVQSENERRRAEGAPVLVNCHIQVLGQTALLEARIDLELAVTQDVDIYASLDHLVQKKLEELLLAQGKYLDPDSDLIWMPKETEYASFFKGIYVQASLAVPDYVLLSKALKAPKKNLPLIRSYIASGATNRFFALAQKYQLDLEQFV